MDDVPVLLMSEDVKDVDQVLSVVFTYLPSNFGEFIKWVAEVRRREDGGQNLSQEEKGRLATKVFFFFTFFLLIMTQICIIYTSKIQSLIFCM